MLSFGFIGFGNHAERLSNYLSGILGEHREIHYHPTKKTERGTNQLSDLYNCDLVFITSPNETHFTYLKNLLKRSKVKIFCEKPPCTCLSNIQFLRNLSNNEKSRVYFNFNFRRSLLARKVVETFDSEEIGKVVFALAIMSHGLAFKEDYPDTWRGKYPVNKSAVLDTSLIHLIDMFGLAIRSPMEMKSSNPASFSHGWDSFGITLRSAEGGTVFVGSSYAAPCSFSVQIVGTNGIFDLMDDRLRIKSPRDTFNRSGFFVPPPIVQSVGYSFEEDYDFSLKESILYALKRLLSSSGFCIREFDASLQTNELTLLAQEKVPSGTEC